MTKLQVVGKRISRVDGLAKALGQAKYTADLKRQDMLIGKALFAKYPHAIIKRIDVSKAAALEGVCAVMTAKDLPGRNGYGIIIPDKPVIADGKTRYEGDPVALVAATTEEIARQALQLIEVEYEVLPAYDDPREAMKDDAVNIHDNHPFADKGNILTVVNLGKGDVDKAFRDADIVIEKYYETPMVEHCYLENDSCIAEPDLLTGGITLTCPAQAVYSSKRCLAPVFGLPQNKVRIVSPIIGGGFGGKEDATLDVCAMAGVLALKVRKPLYFELSREEVFRTSGKRHAAYVKYKLAATKEGKITAIDVESVLNKGAYSSLGGLREPFHGVTQRHVAYLGGVYVIPHARVKAYSVFTNNPYSCAFRGFGVPQAIYAIECQIDELAKKLNMDPLELRRKNILHDGDQTIYGQVMQASRGLGLEECIDKVKARMDWDQPFDKGSGTVRRGRGIALFMYGTSHPLLVDSANCFASIELDGSLNIAISSSEMGQALTTSIGQIAAETLGVRFADVLVSYSDTAMAPDSGPTVASRSVVLVGNAVRDACLKLRERLLDVAGKFLKADPRNLELTDSTVAIAGRPDTALKLADVVLKAYNFQVPLAAAGFWSPPQPSFRGEDGQGNPSHAYTFGAHGIELEVDTETGEITITRSVLACDVGKAINPKTVEGQMDGGVAQAIGWGIMEETLMNKGVMQNSAFHNYLIPTMKDVPRLESIIVEHPNELGPFGAKGVGEPPIIGGGPAIRNALFDALGFGINVMPLTPREVVLAIKKAKGQ